MYIQSYTQQLLSALLKFQSQEENNALASVVLPSLINTAPTTTNTAVPHEPPTFDSQGPRLQSPRTFGNHTPLCFPEKLRKQSLWKPEAEF